MARSPRTQSTPVKPPLFAEQARMVLPGSEKARGSECSPREVYGGQVKGDRLSDRETQGAAEGEPARRTREWAGSREPD